MGKRKTNLLFRTARSHYFESVTKHVPSSMDKYLHRNKRLAAIRSGETSTPKYEIDWGKIAYTGSLQLCNAITCMLCIITGGWGYLVALLVCLMLILLNLYWLSEDKPKDMY